MRTAEEIRPDENGTLDFKLHFLDSGAFTLDTLARKWAKKENRPRSEYFGRRKNGVTQFRKHFREYMDAYVTFVKKYEIGIDYYATVDVMYNPQLSYDSFAYLEKRGLHPVPIVHLGTDPKWLQRYIDDGHDFIGIGASGREAHLTRGDETITTDAPARTVLDDWLRRCFNLVCDTPDGMPKVKIHGFGATGFKLLHKYPFYSVDSTAWKKRAGYGKMFIPQVRDGVFRFDLHWYDIFCSQESKRIEVGGQAHIGEEISRDRDCDFRLDWGKGKNHRIADAEWRLATMQWIDFIDIPAGTSEIVDGEWVIITEGYSNSQQMRSYANLRFFEEVCKTLPKWPFAYPRKNQHRRFTEL